MESDESQEKYLKHYIQRQEMLLLDHIRKTIELELKAISLNASLIEYKSKYEESQKQVEIQNEIMKQAATGVESLTIEKKFFEQKESDYNKKVQELNKNNEDLKKSLQECKNERQKITQEYNDFKNSQINNDKKFEDLNNEYCRQTEELSKLYQENQKLKNNQPINKKKSKAILPPDEF
jgi:chromosome segregation ATPase